MKNKGLFNFFRDDVEKFVMNVLSITTLNDNINELPDLFIYVFESDKIIAYQRLDTKQFFNFEEYFVLKLLPDPFRMNDQCICDAGVMTLQIKLDIKSLSKENNTKQDKKTDSNKNTDKTNINQTDSQKIIPISQNSSNIVKDNKEENKKSIDNKIKKSNLEKKKSFGYMEDDNYMVCAGRPLNSIKNSLSNLKSHRKLSKYTIAVKIYQVFNFNQFFFNI